MIKKLKVNIPPIDSLLKLGLLLLIIKVLANASGVIPYADIIDDIISVLAAFCFGLTILKKVYKVKTLVLFCVLLVLAAISMLKVGNMAIMLTVMTCIAMYGEDIDDVMQFIYFYELMFIVINLFLAIICTPFGYNWLVYFGGGTYKINMGFSHPNGFSAVLSNITLIWVWRNYDKITVKNTAVIVGIHIFFYLFTGCRTSLLAFIGVAMLLILFYRHEKLRIVLNVATASAVPLISVVVYYLIVAFRNQSRLVLLADKILSTRVRLGSYAYERYGASFLGQDISGMEVKWDSVWQVNVNPFTFDNLYSYFIVNYGIVWLILISVMFFLIARKGVVRHNIAILVWCFYGITETHGSNPIILFPLLLIAVLYENEEERPSLCTNPRLCRAAV